MSSRWPDKYLPGGEWHKAWQKTLDGDYTVEAIRAFHAGDFRLWHAEMPRERILAMEHQARAILKSLRKKEQEQLRQVKLERYGGSFWLDALLPSAVAEDLHGNLEEFYPTWRHRHGTFRASLIVNLQIVRVIGGYWATPLMACFDRVVSLLPKI